MCCLQVAVHLMVEQSRKACSAVANGEADCAIIGGDVPDELAHVLKVGSHTSLKDCSLEVRCGPLHISVREQSKAIAGKLAAKSALAECPPPCAAAGDGEQRAQMLPSHLQLLAFLLYDGECAYR